MNGHDAVVELPVEITVEETAEGVRYRLPVREWPSRWAGWILLAFGIVLVIGAIGLATLTPTNSAWPIGAFVLIVSAALGSLGLLLCLWGQNTLSGRVDIALHSDQVLATEITGRVRWTRKRPTVNLTRIHIMHEWQHVSSNVMHSAELARVAYRLVLEYESGQRRMLVKWYSRERLEPVGRDITRRLGLTEPVAVQVFSKDESDEEPIEQPAGSMIVIERNSDGLTAVIPPLGIVSSKDGRSVTRLVGGGVVGAIGGMLAMVVFGIGPWWIWAMFSVPAFAGVLSVTAGLLGQRDTYIDIVDDTMLISTKGWRGVRQHRWRREQLNDITLGESVVEINDENLPQLHIIPKDGEPVKLLTGRRRDEIHWLAHTLREAMNIEKQDDA